MYIDDFKEALERTKRLNIETTNIVYNSKKYAIDEIINRTPYYLRDEYGDFDIEDLAGQCLNMNMKLKNFISKVLDTEMYYTIGYTQEGKNYYFQQTEESLLDMINIEQDTSKVNLHAWLTLPSMEIIDTTFLTTYSFVHGYNEGLGAIIFDDADKIQHMKFIPMLVGDDFIFKARLVQGISFHF